VEVASSKSVSEAALSGSYETYCASVSPVAVADADADEAGATVDEAEAHPPRSVGNNSAAAAIPAKNFHFIALTPFAPLILYLFFTCSLHTSIFGDCGKIVTAQWQ
jgi:hypothetical protein